LIALALALSTGCGSDEPGDTAAVTTTAAAPPPTTALPGSTVPSDELPSTSAPRWETVTTLAGTGPQGYDLAILPDAIQWRVRWTCDTGHLRMTTTPPPRRAGPLVDEDCPGQGEGFSIQTGSVRLDVEASGPWRAIVDQQVDQPLAEPPPAEAAGAPVLAQGPFYPIEKPGSGKALLYQLPDGRRVLRFENFVVAQNTDLFVWLSEAPEPKTSAEAVGAPKVDIGNLKSTLGTQNYEIPADLPTDRIRSIVIWCEPVHVAYSGASLSS
jgi:hypothetical protein